MKALTSRLRLAPLALLAAALLAGCQVQEGGTDIPNELRGRQFVPGQPAAAAANAEVRLVPVGHVPGPDGHGDSLNRLILTTHTDDRGEFAFLDVPRGLYNVIAIQGGKASFRDSLYVTGRNQVLGPDTLTASGSLTGRIRLQPQHFPQTATVQVLGTTLAVNVDEEGLFVLQGLGEGRYRLRVVTTEPGYTPLYREVAVRSGRFDTLPEPLQPFYSGIPVVEGLWATAEIDGTVRLHWHPGPTGKVQAYLIYRDSAGAIELSGAPIARSVYPSFHDTIYSRTPKPGQSHYQDTVARRIEYRVRIRNMSDEVGPVFGSVTVEAIPPMRTLTSGLWRHGDSQTTFAARSSASLVVARKNLWLLGGYAPNGRAISPEIYASADGFAWRNVASPDVFKDTSVSFEAAALGDSLWVVRSARRNGWRLQLWTSGDGVDWRNVVDSLPIPTLRDFELVAHGEELWVLGGVDAAGNPRAAYRSGPDRKTWSELPQDGRGPVGRLSATTHSGRLFALDSATNLWCLKEDLKWDLAKAASEYPSTLFGRPFLSHGDKLWILSGPTSVAGPPGSGPNQVWNSVDGSIWTQVDAIAPFGARRNAATASFQGKIWVVGGDGVGDGSKRDIWYYFDGD